MNVTGAPGMRSLKVHCDIKYAKTHWYTGTLVQIILTLIGSDLRVARFVFIRGHSRDPRASSSTPLETAALQAG